ncbi:MAG TPA: DUF3093 domain-containing protein [Streptosporangiaceae bacterium]|nr:DUF3093 domain-containing protein [Streptosporangiaceae bacterium]
MRNYREHLRVPASYWGLGLITMTTFASFVWAGFDMLIGVAAYAVLVGLPGVALLILGEKTVRVSDGELRAGRAVLPLGRAGLVQALDEKQTAQLRGPLADPAAFMLVRPYLRRAVYVEVTGDFPVVRQRSRRGKPGSGDQPRCPYLLIGSRHPEALAAAIETTRPQSRAGDPSVA